MKPKVLLLLNNRLLRLEVKKKLEDKADVYAGVTLEDLIPEIKWTDIGSVLIDMTDKEMDGYGMLEVLNTTYPSIPVYCMVNNQKDAKEYGDQSKNNFILENVFDAGAIADKILGALDSGAKPEAQNANEAARSTNARESYAKQMQRLQGNLRRIDDYVWGEITQTVKQENIPWKEVEWLETMNIGLEGFLQIQIEGREER